MAASCSFPAQGNLGCENQNKRLRSGVYAFAGSLGLAVLLLKLEVAPLYRLTLFIPFLFASIGVYQGLFKTCSFLAAQGLRDLDDGPEKIANPEERAEVKRLGRRVLAMVVGTATLMTLLLMLA